MSQYSQNTDAFKSLQRTQSTQMRDSYTKEPSQCNANSIQEQVLFRLEVLANTLGEGRGNISSYSRRATGGSQSERQKPKLIQNVSGKIKQKTRDPVAMLRYRLPEVFIAPDAVLQTM